MRQRPLRGKAACALKRLGRLHRHLSLTLVAGGIVGAVVATGEWGRNAFGDLDPVSSLRLVIPSATALVIGVQLSLAGFFYGLLGMGELRSGSRGP